MIKIKLLIALLILIGFNAALAQGPKAYFIDGYHGGVWGHYPDMYTSFIIDQLKQNPNWKINLEIEPETWDKVKNNDPEAYAKLQTYFKDQSYKTERVAYVNPAYGQAYLYNISGESIIRQFYYGIKKIRLHFPGAVFTAYSSEEPCFTSALPQILTSFGFKYASLKNPNTCWGGYTRAHGGEMVSWTGSDGSKILTVPRYNIEGLQKGSAWQTIAWYNSPDYVNAALAAGIQHPVGMTLQDAGWKNGPFLGKPRNGLYQPTEYTTWHSYFENIGTKTLTPQWRFNQEDVLVSLVWGSKITQQIAQQVRVTENKIISAEKIATLNKIYDHSIWPGTVLDSAWRTLLLAQHHDCWIVPYNGPKGDTWADKVRRWTDSSDRKCDSIINRGSQYNKEGKKYIKVYNPSGAARSEVVSVDLPADWMGKQIAVMDMYGKITSSQFVPDKTKLLFKADVPSMGYNTYQLELSKPAEVTGARSWLKKGKYHIETDLYHMVVDPAKGGLIESLMAKTLDNKEFVDKKNERGFNELRGNFYNHGGFRSSKDDAATVSILEEGPLRVVLQIKGTIDNYPFTQLITLAEGQRVIDIDLNIQWKGNPGIGKPTAPGTYKLNANKKAFYDDQYKLLATFPLNLNAQKVFKNAPFDVMESKLTDTFFDSWDGIKNNVILNWVDVTDGNETYGMTLLTDHTTSYTHGAAFPLGLNIQYSGMGLWGRNYTIDGPTHIHYALIPHEGKWDKSGIWKASTEWNQPLIAKPIAFDPLPGKVSRSFMHIKNSGLEISSMLYDGDNILLRLFNAEGDDKPNKIEFDGQFIKAQLVELNDEKGTELKITKNDDRHSSVEVTIPRFGFRTIKLIK